ncbi:MAG: DUF4956 domain-containing protein [Bacteroidota bacterium]|nr:DUF4956 domain-containing protein [Bacteroidota bacterium]
MLDLVLLPLNGDIDLGETKVFLLRFGLTIITLLILVRLLYYEYRKEGIPEYLFGFFLMGVAVFMICTVLFLVEIAVGLALGLFALFGILRFRTQAIPVREMAYLFLVIAVSMINSLVLFENPLNGIILYNSLILIPVWVLEIFLSTNKHMRKEIVYNNLEDVYKGEEHLKTVLIELTGLKIVKVDIGKIDMVRQQASLIVYYRK